MKGIDLVTLENTLFPVSTLWEEKPVYSIADLATRPIVMEVYDGNVDRFIENCHCIHEGYLDDFSFEELCKLNYSSIFMTNGRFGDLFENEASYEVTRKIRNSMWCWGTHSACWNETVSAYKGICAFTLGLGKHFEVRLDYTTGCNDMGYSKYTRTFLDGVFAFLVYYKGVHVMTIGFSILGDQEIIIRQVQLVKPKGNRWLYKLPGGQLPFAIDRMKAAFPKHIIYLVDGDTLVDGIVTSYTQGLNDATHWHNKYLSYAEQSTDKESRARHLENAEQKDQTRTALAAKIKDLQNDRARLVAFYNSTGHHRFVAESKRPGLPRRLTA